MRRFLRLLATLALSGLALVVSSGGSASALSPANAVAYDYDASCNAYVGAIHTVQAHANEPLPSVSQIGSDGPQDPVDTAAGVFSKVLLKSVAANTGPRFVAAADGTIIDTMAPALAQQIDDVVTSLRTTGTPPTGVYQGGYRGQPGVYANLGGDLPPQPIGYYTESGVWPGAPGTERIVIGQQPGEVWYSPDHYGTFRSWP